MRKAVGLICALALCLTACGGGKEVQESSAEETSEQISQEPVSQEPEEKEEADLHNYTRTYIPGEISGTHEGTAIKNGALVLAEGENKGSFTAELDIGSFTTLLASWNAVTYAGTVEMAVSFEAEDGNRSDFLSWGKWSSKPGVTGSSSLSDQYGKVGIDIYEVKEGHRATGKVWVKLELTRGSKSPVVKNFSLTTPQTPKQQVLDGVTLPKEALNDVPMRSQLAAENGSDGNRICSPTTVVMALDYMGTKQSTMTAAKAIYDNNWGAYGNWSYAVAYAGEMGYTAYLDLYDREMTKYALSQGYVIGCSTKLTSSGHLVLLVGYTVIDGEEYYICNDPNVNEDNPVRTNYKMDFFEDRWFRSDMGGKGVAYVFADKPENK